jgi:hypothetical protein
MGLELQHIYFRLKTHIFKRESRGGIYIRRKTIYDNK